MKGKLVIALLLSVFLFTSSCAQKTTKVVVFSKTEGWRHKSIETGVESIIKLGKENNFKVQTTEDSDKLIAALDSCKVAVFLNTTGDVLNKIQQGKFESFIKKGGGFVGIHAATDTEYDWPWYVKMIGANFESHPEQQEAIVQVVNKEHLATNFLDDTWSTFDEWYNFKNINPNVNVLLNLDESSYVGGKNGKNHPMAWYHEYDGGRIFYTGLGHTKESYQDSTFLKHLLGGIQYAIGLDKETSPKNKWIQLFNGKDLSNWIVKIKGHPVGDNYKNTFRVVDGVLQVNYDEYCDFKNTFGHLFYKKSFSNYKLRLQYRFIGNQVNGGPGWAEKNSGVMIHSQLPESMLINQDFPVSIEVQLLGGLKEGEKRPTGNLCTPGTHIIMNDNLIKKHCINSSSKTYNNEQWVNLELLVLNDSLISHTINGEKVLSYSNPTIGGEFSIDTPQWKSREGKPLKEGYISLQSESHPIEFRNIELLELEQ